MTTLDKKMFPLRIEELPVIGSFLYNSLVRDVADFVPYIAFATPYAPNYLIQLDLVTNAVSPETIISQMKMVTFNLLTSTFTMRANINKAEIYFNTAGKLLNVKPKDMGQHGVRVAIARGDVEEILGAMKTLNQNIFNNSLILSGQGFTAVMQDALVTATTQMKTDNDTQNSLYEFISATASTNMVLFNKFWTTYASPTATTGRLIYKVANKTKAKNYTVSILVARVRNDQKQTEVHGLVEDALKNPQNKAKVKLIPVGGGRTKTVYTDDKGLYSMSGMSAGDYNMVVTSGVLVKIIAVKVVTRVHLEVNVVVG